MNTMYAICWNNEKTGKVVITCICSNEEKAYQKCNYHNERENIHYVVPCNDID
jgi:hypothetical protein